MEFLRERARRLFDGLAIVFHFKTYWLVALLAVAFFAWFFVHFTSIPGQSFAGWLYSMPDTTKAFVVFGSLLAGITVALQAFSLKNLQKTTGKAKSAGAGAVALFSGIASIACCSPLFATVFAFSGVITFITFNQPWFIGLSAILLLVALYYSAKPIACSDCRVKLGVNLKTRATPDA